MTLDTARTTTEIETDTSSEDGGLPEKCIRDNLITFIDAFKESNPNLDNTALQDHILNWIESMRFEYSGYYFINRLDGQALIYEGKTYSGRDNRFRLSPHRLVNTTKRISQYGYCNMQPLHR